MVADHRGEHPQVPEEQAYGSHSAETFWRASMFRTLASTLAEDLVAERNASSMPRALLATYAVRKTCGCWLAWQRLRRGLTAAQIEDATGVGAEAVALLEAGLASTLDGADVGAEDERRSRYSMLLADGEHDADLVMIALRVATGAYEGVNPTIIERLADELPAGLVSLRDLPHE
jgi:hypothetical protein